VVDSGAVTLEVVLAREGACAAAVRADIWLRAVGIVRFHVRLEIEGACECCGQDNSRLAAAETNDAGDSPRGQFGHWCFRRESM
jgi:hypothetical protein